MSAIYSWGVADELNFKGPYIVKDGKYIRDQIYTVKKSDPPISQRTNDAGRKLYLVLHKGQLAEVIKSDYSFTLDPNDLVDQLKLIIDQQNLQG